jgi:phosphate transport system substrate-binding protein
MPQGGSDIVRPSGLRKASAIAVLAAGAVALTGAATAAGGKVKILETGSTLLYPLFNLWVPKYTKLHPNVEITTQGTGSGTGISEAIDGVAQIGASDAYMSNLQVKQHPQMLNIPLAISSQVIAYNLPGVSGHLRLSGPVLAGIYSGRITEWDARPIAELNRGVKLPHHVIIPIRRTDGSGDTFIFTQYLAFSTPSWASSVGYGTTVSWPPVRTLVGAVGNPGMIQALRQNPYSIAYVGISWLNEILADHLGYAALENRAGRFVLPTRQTIEAAVAALAPKTPADERQSLVYAPGPDAYPIINYEYAIVNAHQSSPQVAQAVAAFLRWAVSPQGGGASAFLNAVHFLPLPKAILPLSLRQIAKIH